MVVIRIVVHLVLDSSFPAGWLKIDKYAYHDSLLAFKSSEVEEYLDKFDSHFSGRDFWLVTLVENLPIFDLELDVLVEGNAAPHPLEDVQVGGDS